MNVLLRFGLTMVCCWNASADSPEVIKAVMLNSGRLVIVVHQYTKVPTDKRPKLFIEFNSVRKEVESHDFFVVGSQTGLKSVLFEFMMETKNRKFALEAFHIGAQLPTILFWAKDGIETSENKVIRISGLDAQLHQEDTRGRQKKRIENRKP